MTLDPDTNLDPRLLARVQVVTGEGWFLEFKDGRLARQDTALPQALKHGDVFLIDEDTLDYAPAPPQLWATAPVVAVVRALLEDHVVLDIGTRLLHVPRSTCPCEVDNSVLYSEDLGVTQVISSRSLLDRSGKDIDGTPSVHRRNDPLHDEENFESIGGYRLVREEIRQFVADAFRLGDEFRALGVRPQRGLILSGPSGTGKTMHARIIANEARVPYFTIDGPAIHSRWLGDSHRAVREVFDEAGNEPQSLIIFDELDSAAGMRGGETHEENNRVIAQLLTRMDGIDKSGNIVVAATTNRVDSIDDALRRPGRFDREIFVGPPNSVDREEILRKSAPNSVVEGLPFKAVAIATEGWTGADLVGIWRQAGSVAVKARHTKIYKEDFQLAFERTSEFRTRREGSVRTVAE